MDKYDTVNLILQECRQCQGVKEVSETCAAYICDILSDRLPRRMYSAMWNLFANYQFDRDALQKELSYIINHDGYYAKSGPDARLMMDMLGTYLLNRKD